MPEREREAFAEFEGLQRKLLQQLKQKAKVRWAGEGDANTGFYHAVIRQRRQQNQITEIHTTDGGVLVDEGLIKKHVLQFYMNLLGTKVQRVPIRPEIITRGATVSRQEGERLVRTVTRDEIKQALWSI